MLLGRLARYLKSHEHLLIRPQRITVVFVVSDVSTFLIQVGIASMSGCKRELTRFSSGRRSAAVYLEEPEAFKDRRACKHIAVAT